MKKNKTKSLLACAVLASVMAVGNVAGATGSMMSQIKSDTVNTGIYFDGTNFAVRWGRNTSVNVKGGTAWGDEAVANGAYSTAWGRSTQTNGDYSTAWGWGSVANGAYSTAWGDEAVANEVYSTAWGYYTHANGEHSTAWGNSTYAQVEDSTAWGYNTTASGYAATAWGYKSYAKGDVSTAFGEGSKAAGKNSLAALGGITGTWETNPIYNTTSRKWTTEGTYTSGGDNAVAIGQGAHAKLDNTVAIGQYAVTSGSLNAVSYNPAGDTSLTFAGNVENGKKVNEFAVGGGTNGGNTYYSRITGVAAGNITADSTDAINGSQLYQVAEALKSAGGGDEVVGTTNQIAVTEGTGDNEGKMVIGLDSAITGKLTTYDTYVTSSGLNANSKKITNVANGSVANDSKDAVNGGQLYSATHMGSAAGKNYDANATVVTAVSNLDTKIGTYDATNVKGKYTNGGNVATDVKALDTAIGDMSNFGSNNYAKNTANVATNIKSLDTQVKTNADAIATYKIKELGTGETNLVLANDGKLTLKKTVDLTSSGSLTIGSSVLSNTGLAITNGPSLTTTGLTIGTGNTWTTSGLTATSITATTGKFGDKVTISATGIAMGSQKITGLANGTDATDAVNLKQMNDAIATAGSSSEEKLKGVMSYDSTTSKFTADGVVAASGTGTDHVVTGATVYNAIKNNINYSSDAKTGAVADEISLRSHTASEKTYGTLIHNVQDGVADTDAVNKGQLDAATTMSEAGYNYAVNTSVTNAVKALDTALGTYSYDGMKNNNYANTGVVATDVKALDTAIGNMSGFATENTYAKSATVAANLKDLDTAIAAINNTSTGVLAQAKTYTDNLASGQVTTNKTDIATLKTTVEDNRNTLQGQIDSIKYTGDKLGVYYDNDEHTSITLKPTDGTVIHNLKAGTDDMDAVNVRQLNDTITERLTKNSNSKGEQAMVLGVGNTVEGNNSTAVGSKNIVKGKASGAFGDPNIVYGDDSYAAGNENIIGVIANPSGVSVDPVSGNISGIADTDKKVDHAYAFGYGNKITAEKGLAFGNNNEVSGVGGVAIGNNAVVSAENSVALGNDSVATVIDSVDGTNGVVSVGAEGKERRITNVRDGVLDTDAATVGQLNSAVQNIGSNFSDLSNRVDRMGTRINKVGAGAAALAAMHPLDFDPDNKLSFSVGVGNYRSENAAALGVFYRPVDRVMFSMGATMGNDNNMVNAGVTFALDRKLKFANGLGSAPLGKASRETLVNEVQLLNAENIKLNNKVKDLDDKVAKLMKVIEELKKK